MENTSKGSFISPDYETAAEESISMYFSFNSTVAEKTMEAEQFKSDIFEKEDEDHLKTVIKKAGLTPQRTVSKNVLQELTMFSSTPARKLNIDNMGMAALGVAPLDSVKETSIEIKAIQLEEKVGFDADADNSTFKSNIKSCEENSRNDTSNTNGSNHASISSIIVVECSESFSEQEKFVKDTRTPLCKNIENTTVNEYLYSKKEGDKNDSFQSAKNKDLPIIIEILDSSSDSENKENFCNVKGPVNSALNKLNRNIEDKNHIKINSDQGKESKKIPEGNKRHSSTTVRKSIVPSEPDLIRNKPSRIFDKKRISLATTSKLSPSKFATQIPRFLSKIIEGKSETTLNIAVTGEQKTEVLKKPNNRKSMLPQLPKRIEMRRTVSVQPLNKQLSTIKQKINLNPELNQKLLRTSGILKTTLNSSAIKRQSIRKTLASKPTATNALRRSVLPGASKDRISCDSRSKFKNPEPNKLKQDNSKVVKSTQVKSTVPISGENFKCEKCFRTFRLLSSLETHKRTHLTAITSPPMCKYCDKKFAIAKALQNHLLEKCPKIPTAERKKLLFSSTIEEKEATTISIGKTLKIQSSKQILSASTCSTDSIASVNQASDSKNMPPPLPSSKTKKKILQPHSGVYRTPNKPVVCHPCKKNFDNVLNFTEHVLSHSSSDPDT